jgi:hypothetical protein
LIHAADEREAQSLVPDVLAAARDFERYFGQAPPPGAVVALADSVLPAGADAALRARGARWVLPWMSLNAAASVDGSLRAQIESQLRAQLAPLGMDEAEIQAQLDQVLSRLAGSAAGGLAPLRHELGHVWFLAAYWGPEALASPRAGGHYAGPAADWLDETAAILLESETLTERRRSDFSRWLAAHPEDLRPLEELFRMPHPVDLDALGVTPEQAAEGAVIVRVQSGPAPESEAGSCPFYEQCRSVVDYLIAVGGERVVASIAASAARGEDIGEWLAARGAEHGLPASVESLEQAWREHIGTAAAEGG